MGGGYPLNGCDTVIKTGCFMFVSSNILAVNTLTTKPKINICKPYLHGACVPILPGSRLNIRDAECLSPLSFFRARKVPHNVPAGAAFLCGRAVMLGETMKRTHYVVMIYRFVDMVIS